MSWRARACVPNPGQAHCVMLILGYFITGTFVLERPVVRHCKSLAVLLFHVLLQPILCRCITRSCMVMSALPGGHTTRPISYICLRSCQAPRIFWRLWWQFTPAWVLCDCIVMHHFFYLPGLKEASIIGTTNCWWHWFRISYIGLSLISCSLLINGQLWKNFILSLK